VSGELAAALDAACRNFADRVAVQDWRESLSYADLSARAHVVAAELTAARATPDEPVIVVVGNRAVDFAAFLGIWRAGCVAVPSHCTAPPAVLTALIERSGARFVVEDAAVRLLARSAPPGRDLLRGAAFVIFTSGSTGLPKGAVISHRALAGKLAANDSYLHFGPDARTLLALQITFSFGIWVSLLTLAKGGSLHALERFDAERALHAIDAHGIERVAFVPTMLRAILALGEREPERMKVLRDPCTLRLLMTGGESLGAQLGGQARALFPTARLVDIYGLTETATCDFVLQGADLDVHAGCIGRPAPGVAFRIATDEGGESAAGQTGELQIRTPYAMNGYLDAPELTRAAFADGYFRTGDLARERVPGVVELVGRAKEIISRGGNKIAPLEVEQVLQQHPAVAQALVTGVPDAQLGERTHALIVARSGKAPTGDELRAWSVERMEKYKLPDAWHFGAELPLGRTGKVDRGRLRELIVAGTI
jgi:long-chain acyl-CoA synthetase